MQAVAMNADLNQALSQAPETATRKWTLSRQGQYAEAMPLSGQADATRISKPASEPADFRR
jgi:hypothetical protein